MDTKQTDIIVLSRQKVLDFVTDRPYLLISIRDPQNNLVIIPTNPNEVARLDLDFSDWDLEINPELMNNPKIKGFTKEDAKSILKVLELTLPYINLIVCQCEAGISRSAGIGAAIAKILGQSDELFFSKKGPYIPNRFIYRTILNVYQDSRPIGE